MNISNFEFSALPKALFGPDGKMYHCNAKSKLVGILESLAKDESNTEKSSQVPNGQLESESKKAAILDGMAFLHTYFKPTHIKTCEDLCIDISKKILLKFGHYNEVHVVFDTYFSDSLKKDARENRSQGKDPVQYRISAEMKVGSISMARLLAHEKTKDEITAFLAEKILKITSEAKKKFIVSWRDKAQSSEDLADVSSLCTTQEEADTKIILHAVYLASNGLDITHIFSPDTDVMVLALRRIPRLTPQVGIFLGQGMKKFVDLIPIFNALGPLKASALPGLHALSGADITGSFINKGKLKWWKTFIDAGDDIHEALAKLGTGSSLDEEIRQRLEELVCKLYIPKTALKDVGEVRWWLFTKKQCQDENLPPTRGALDPAFLRAHLQASIWRQDLKQNPELPPALNCGWKKNGENFEPIPCVGPCVPEVAMELCRCNCGQKRCAPPCTCRAHNLKCTEMCKCEGKLDLCDNFDIEDEDDDDEERTMCSDTSDSSDDGEE
ncbi:unnamed protein product [Bemisia tabaci]|uniref:Tesmin/TSO1-like CXC domain-containing protein n=1 Tax=Bemisia tabaci TaxID=7038 RepID=A0A9P0A5Y1_BEMTA|nr:unnamed protein product [Bemisia tabaci]